MADQFVIEPFDKHKHHRAAFSCEHEALTTYLKRQASQEIRKHVAAVFVLADGNTIAGYFTLSQYAVDASDFPAQTLKSLGAPGYQRLPATLIGRLARDLGFKGKGAGELLLMAALKQALAASKRIASLAVIVDAKDDHAKNFYKKYGFIELPDHASRLFLPMKTIEEMSL